MIDQGLAGCCFVPSLLRLGTGRDEANLIHATVDCFVTNGICLLDGSIVFHRLKPSVPRPSAGLSSDSIPAATELQFMVLEEPPIADRSC